MLIWLVFITHKRFSVKTLHKPALNDVDRVRSIAFSCGELCDCESQRINPVFGLNTTYRHVELSHQNCRTLFLNPYMFQSSNLLAAPDHIPAVLVSNFTMNGRIPRREYYKNNVYLGNNTRKLTWTQEQISSDSKKLRNGLLYGTYGYHASKDLFKLVRLVDIRGARVLIVGSEKPWVEVIALEAGARETVTLEFSEIDAQDPRMSTYTPSEFVSAYVNGRIQPFDVVLSYSSFEHTGLGRYGDALNPWGDVISLAMAWCVSRPQAALILEVPRATSDVLLFNAHRYYGPNRLPFLTTNWAQMVADSAWNSSLPLFGDLARPLAFRRMGK